MQLTLFLLVQIPFDLTLATAPVTRREKDEAGGGSPRPSPPLSLSLLKTWGSALTEEDLDPFKHGYGFAAQQHISHFHLEACFVSHPSFE